MECVDAIHLNEIDVAIKCMWSLSYHFIRRQQQQQNEKETDTTFCVCVCWKHSKLENIIIN